MDIQVKLRILKCLSVGKIIAVEGDTFVSSGGSDPGVVKILEPISLAFNYFECEIIGRGKKGLIGIGVGELDYPLDKMPGWEKNGIGYHADDGNLFNGTDYGVQLGPTCSVGDIMGCGVDFETDIGYGYVHFFHKEWTTASQPYQGQETHQWSVPFGGNAQPWREGSLSWPLQENARFCCPSHDCLVMATVQWCTISG